MDISIKQTRLLSDVVEIEVFESSGLVKIKSVSYVCNDSVWDAADKIISDNRHLVCKSFCTHFSIYDDDCVTGTILFAEHPAPVAPENN